MLPKVPFEPDATLAGDPSIAEYRDVEALDVAKWLTFSFSLDGMGRGRLWGERKFRGVE
jgi:hypothetical protein